MIHWIRTRLTFANVVAVLALFLALGTGAVLASGRHASTGKVVGYARVKPTGAVVASKSLNVDSSNVRRESTSAYCFRHLPFNFKGAQVTIDYSKAPDGAKEEAEFALGNPFHDCAGNNVQAEVSTSNGTDFEPQAFFIEFYK